VGVAGDDMVVFGCVGVDVGDDVGDDVGRAELVVHAEAGEGSRNDVMGGFALMR
jgi:hypothetical protein